MLKEQITNLLLEGVEKGDFPGASYAVIYKDGRIISDFLGYKQTLGEKIKNDGSEIYDCASLTKVVSTTTMIMKMMEEGLFDFETKISSLLPEFKHKEIRIKHLLTHSSGLPADIPKAKTLKNKEDVVERVYNFDLINPIGEKVVYSDIGYILLGFIIEKLSGKSLDEYSRDVIFSPLKMTDTSYHPKKERCAPTEYRDDDVYKGLLQGLVHDEKAFALSCEAGHAGMFSTVHDLSRFILSFLRNDEQVLKKDTVDLLFPVRIKDVNKNGYPLVRSYGWDKPTIGGTAGDGVSFDNTIVHTGFTGCNMWIEKEKGIGFVMLSNAVHPKRELNGIIKYRKRIGNLIIPTLEV